MIVFSARNPDANTYLHWAGQIKLATDAWPTRGPDHDLPAGSDLDADTNWQPACGADSGVVAGLTPGASYDVRFHLIDGNNQPVSASTAAVRVTPVPAVRLSASPQTVDEGSSVAVTATLAAALAGGVTIPLTVTDGTAEPEDHGTLANIAIAAGATSGSGTITTSHDADDVDETFTVALGALPPEVVAGSPASVRITIRDDDTGTAPPPDDGTGDDGGTDDGDSGDDDGDDDGGGGSDGGSSRPAVAVCRPYESPSWGSISNRCGEFDEGYCHRRRLGEAFLRRNASSTVVMLESDADFDLCIYDRDRSDEWPTPIYVARREDCVNYSLDSHGLAAQLTGKPEDHDVEIAELPDIARMDYCVVPFGDAVGRWDVRFHQPATLYGTVVPGSRRCPRWYSDNGGACASWGGSNYANLTVKLENCRGSWIDKGGSCDEPFVVMPVERADVADDGGEKCAVVNEDRTLRDVDGVRRPTLELAYCFFSDETRKLGTYRD